MNIFPQTLLPMRRYFGFSQQLSVDSLSAPITWEIVDTALTGEMLSGEISFPPPGITISSTGLLSGFPTADGIFVFYVRATDALNNTTSARYFAFVASTLSSKRVLIVLVEKRVVTVFPENRTILVG